MAFYNSPRIITDNLVACWDAANSKSYPGSGTTWVDISGKGHNATVTGATFISTLNSGVWDFDGSNDYISAADSDDFSFGSGAFTIEAWINPTTINNKAFIAKWKSGQYEWFFGTNGNELKFAYSTNGSGMTILDSGYDMQTGQWQHIVATRDSSSKIRIFVNGIHRGATHSASATFNNGTEELEIANNSDETSWRPEAKISNVRIYKGKGFTVAEVQQNFNATRTRFGV